MGTPAVLYCFLFLYFSAAGAGPWSLDAKRGK
jgi:putative oxidoreductase